MHQARAEKAEKRERAQMTRLGYGLEHGVGHGAVLRHTATRNLALEDALFDTYSEPGIGRRRIPATFKSYS